MDKNASQTPLDKTGLTVIRQDEKLDTNAKLVILKKIGYKPQILLPPPQEKYIKTKKNKCFFDQTNDHTFFIGRIAGNHWLDHGAEWVEPGRYLC